MDDEEPHNEEPEEKEKEEKKEEGEDNLDAGAAPQGYDETSLEEGTDSDSDSAEQRLKRRRIQKWAEVEAERIAQDVVYGARSLPREGSDTEPEITSSPQGSDAL